MKLSFASVLITASAALAAPLAQRQPNSAAQSLSDMVAGAYGFPAAFLAGDLKGSADSLALMTSGAANFPIAYLSGLNAGPYYD
jgi:hypothetical protein